MTFETRFSYQQAEIISGLDTPVRIQEFLDTCAYPDESYNRSPLRVIDERKAHCLDGGLFAAMALRRLGYPPLVVDIFPDPGMDDDHVLAIFRRHGRWGAVAKSNFTGLRYRDPVYTSLRELVMSYFSQYYNIDGLKTLRTYTMPLNVARFDALGWEWNDAGIDAIEKALLARRRIPLISPETAAELAPVDELTYRAGMLVTNIEGVYKPKKEA
jgi:hypothetical protein